jgi:hypothetical protein
VTSACSTEPSDTTTESEAVTTPASEGVAEAGDVEGVGEVVVYRPGMIDTGLTAGDVPRWPGPAPADFLDPHPPSGERGTLTGDDAAAVYREAQENPETLLTDGRAPRDATGALWWVDHHVEWLVVDPVG